MQQGRRVERRPQTAVREEPVTVTTAYRVTPGYEKEFHSCAVNMLNVTAATPGFLGGGILGAAEAGSEWHVVCRFESEDARQSWEHSPHQARWTALLGQLSEEIRRQNVTGLEVWFNGPDCPPLPAPPSPPPKWKLWFVNMSAVFPPVLLFNLVVTPYLSSLSLLLRTLFLCLTVTAIVTWILMPRLQRFFKKWLYPPFQALRGRHKRRTA
jgi:uncharacterized protein